MARGQGFPRRDQIEPSSRADRAAPSAKRGASPARLGRWRSQRTITDRLGLRSPTYRSSSDSPLEEDGFELPVRGRGQSGCPPLLCRRMRRKRFFNLEISPFDGPGCLGRVGSRPSDRLEIEPRRLLRAGSAALDKTGDRDAVVAPVDLAALQRALFLPAKLGEAPFEGLAIASAGGARLRRHWRRS